jgi:hypothetical protein
MMSSPMSPQLSALLHVHLGLIRLGDSLENAFNINPLLECKQPILMDS